MNFTTKISILKSTQPIDYSSKLLLLGSCFAENMGDKLEYFKFENTVNPFGIIFNPVSIERLIERIVNEIEFTEKDLFFHNERWHCYEVHSDLSHENKDQFLENLNAILESTNNQITQSTHLIITYGTSWIYKLKSTNEVVANCHKVPQAAFEKEILSLEILKKSIQNTIDLIQKVNPNCSFIFTISPVRHLKDGFVENQRSKAHLITALPSAIYNLSSATYFPSYEIIMDELRDYRFYAEDMLHPSQVAIDYIWERFSETTISYESHSVMKEVETIQKGLAHRPFNPNSESHQQFLSKLEEKKALIQKQFPKIIF
ncbi:GSCFA domain-containing protein [Flavobacterium sp.]|uniref:GSCFA domain-containing protein n=1 Tax=Flavobacterium sp. TaxID=239 RepID=UPI0038FBFAEE